MGLNTFDTFKPLNNQKKILVAEASSDCYCDRRKSYRCALCRLLSSRKTAFSSIRRMAHRKNTKKG